MWNKSGPIVLNESPPAWWSASLEEKFLRSATESLPNETCIVFYRASAYSPVNMHRFAADASPVAFSVHAEDVIRFCYDVLAVGGHVEATGHSHPGGEHQFSVRDGMLSNWARYHALAVMTSSGTWQVFWGVSN